MTRPDLLEQAVAEAEQQEAVRAAAQTRSKEHIEDLPKHFEIVEMMELIARPGTAQDIMNARGISASLNVFSDTGRMLLSQIDEMTSDRPAYVAVVRPNGEVTYQEVLEHLVSDKFTDASLRDLLSYPFRQHSKEYDTLWAEGPLFVDDRHHAHALVLTPGVPGWFRADLKERVTLMDATVPASTAFLVRLDAARAARLLTHLSSASVAP